MRDLNYQLKQRCDRNCDGSSYATQSDRARILSHIANQLHDLGYRHMNADSLRLSSLCTVCVPQMKRTELRP